MKIGELYGVICIIFASNFRSTISETDLRKMSKNWILTNETIENKTAHEHWHNALKEDVADIKADFYALKGAFEFSYFKLVNETDFTLFFEKVRYEAPFKELNNSHDSNALAFLSSVLKHDNDEKTHAILGLYLTDYFILTARALAQHLQTHAKSEYYRAMGWFLGDFCNMIKLSLGLKA